MQKSNSKSRDFAVNQVKPIVKVCFLRKTPNSRAKMIHERLPKPFEIYMSWLVATDQEQARGIFVPKVERGNRFGVDRTDRNISFKTYEESILKRAYIQLPHRPTVEKRERD